MILDVLTILKIVPIMWLLKSSWCFQKLRFSLKGKKSTFNLPEHFKDKTLLIHTV